jgi:hypothetical protein
MEELDRTCPDCRWREFAWAMTNLAEQKLELAEKKARRAQELEGLRKHRIFLAGPPLGYPDRKPTEDELKCIARRASAIKKRKVV